MQLKTIHQRKRKYFLLILLLIAVGMTNAQAQVSTWDGSWEPWTSGTGTENDPFLIENAQQLAYLAYQVNNGIEANSNHVVGTEKYYKLMTNIDLNGSESFQWTPIGYWNSNSDNYSFGGCFDGDSHTISGLFINSSVNRVGLFGFINGAIVENLQIFMGSVSTTGNYAGGIIGYMEGSSLSNLQFNDGSVLLSGSSSGGIVGQIHGTNSIDSCQNSSAVTSNGSSGGLIGYIHGTTTISNCHNCGDIVSNGVSSGVGIGGIVGGIYQYGCQIYNCYNTGDVSVNGAGNGHWRYIGGIVGIKNYGHSTITNCYNIGAVTLSGAGGYYWASAILGANNAGYTTITNCYNVGTITSSGTHAGGISWQQVEGGGGGGSVNISNSYYLDTCGGSNTYGGEPKTESFMKSTEFVALLNEGSLTYKKDEQPYINQGYPVFSGFNIETQPATTVSYTSVVLNGSYTLGIYNITSQGFEYKKSSDQDFTTINCTTSETPYSYSLDNLESGTTYQYRAFITTNEGTTAYGNIIEFTTLVLYSIIIEATPTDGGTVNGGGMFGSGTTCTLSATANEGYTFMYWTENGQQVSSNPIYSFTVTQDCSLMAHFALPFSITATADPTDGGTVYGSGEYDYGTICTITATANEGYTFMYWTEDGNVVATYPTYSFNVTTERNLVANFSLPLTINVLPIPEEGGTVDGAGVYYYGTNCTLTALPDADYSFVNWTKNDNVVSNQANYNFIVTENGNYVAHFAPKPVAVVTAMYDPDPNNNQSPYVRVSWTMNPNMVEDFERGDFSLFNWQLDSSYPWSITTNNPYEGSYCMKSGGSGVGNVVSNMSVIVDIPTDGIMSFYGKISSESGWDYGSFYIDDVLKGSWSGNGNWQRRSYDITAGQHTFRWTYRKDGSVNSNDDCLYVDSICFVNSVRGRDRTANHYKVYRDEFHGSGAPVIIADNVTGTNFVDTGWNELSDGEYHYGVKTCYSEVDTSSLYVSNIRWSNRIQKVNPHIVTIETNPTEGGTVAGAGVYLFGTECTVSATANDGYSFMYWMENGEIISTDSIFTFIVNAERELVAYFSLPLTVTTEAHPETGGTITGDGTFDYGQTCTLIATPNEGYTFNSWKENDSVVSYNPSYTFTVTEDRSLKAVFVICTVIGDGGTATNDYLPSCSYYNYSLSQQIYTSDEIGQSGEIISVAFYNGGATKTRTYDIFLVGTDKTVFNGADWIVATADDLVFSGSVTMEADTWTTINFETSYIYDVSTNLALIVDDNSGSLTGSPHMACRVFDANGNQAILINSHNIQSYYTNYNPYNPPSSGSLYSVKNQIVFGFNSTVETDISDEICYGNNYFQNGFEIYNPEVGEHEYSITLPSLQYTDSIVNLTLTVHPVYFFPEDTTLCNVSSYTWRGHTYTESGIYYDSLQTIHGCDSIFQLSLDLFNTPLGEFAGMTPTNNYPFTSLPITFSWDAVSGAEYYNLYLWNANDPAPSEPVASNIYNRSYYASSLQNHQTYNWYVEAVNTCFTMESSVGSFTLNIPPTMHASTGSLNFGEVALNNSHTLTLYVSGNALDDAITLQITGEDASMFSFEQGSNWNGLTGGSLTVSFSPTAVQYNYTANLVITTGTLTQTVQLAGSLSDMFVFNTYVTQDVFEMNSTIPIYGTVMDINNNPMAGAEVEVKVKVMGTTRSLFATTGDDGHFSVEFVPANSESGYYTVNSGRVGHNNTAVHDDFNIPGMNLVTNGWILWDVVQNETSTGSIVIRNRSQIPLTNIQVTATTLPDGCSFTFQPLSLQGMEEGVLEYSVTGSALTSGNNYEEVRLVATSAEGATMNFSAWYYCSEPRGILYAAPNNITTTMTKGNSKIVDVMLYNNGTGPTGSVYLDLPSVDWLSVVGNDTLPSIAVHDSAYFSLRLSANENTPLVQYTGNIAINCERGDGLSLPYSITAVSDSTGTLVVDVTDDYTYNGNGQHLAGATVTVKGYYSLQTVAIGWTGSDGTFTVEDIPEGYYRMSITAPRHAEYQATIQIEGGQTNTQNIYLQYQAITYSWNVVPTEIEDEYTFELVADYETNVPVPVVVIDMPQTFPQLEEGESYVFNYIITNYGLVDTYDATLYPPIGHPLYDFTPLITEIDTLHAQSTIVIPCTMTRKTRQRSPLVYAALNGRGERDDDCPDYVKTEVHGYYYCRGEKIPTTYYCWRQVGTHPCSTPPSSGGGGGGVPGGGGSSGGGGSHYSGSGGIGTPSVTMQQQGCNDDPCQSGALDEMNSCPPPSDNTPNLPPQPGNNRRNNN